MDMFEKKVRTEPPVEEVKQARDFYIKRLHEYGYEFRDFAASEKIAEYFALTYLGLKHEIKPGSKVYSPPEKGLLLFGSTGCGKTFAMSILSRIFDIEFITADVLVQHYAARGESTFWDFVSQWDGVPLIVDDIGSERKTKSFGNEPVIIDFIFRRERLYSQSGILTHFSTNIPSRAEMVTIYGDRAVSRILGMSQAVSIIASDGRLIKQKQPLNANNPLDGYQPA